VCSSDLVITEADEEMQALAAAGRTMSADGEVIEGPIHDGPDFGDEPTASGSKSKDGGSSNSEDGLESVQSEATGPKIRPFESFTELPKDISEALNSFKVAIITHKANDWDDIPRAGISKNSKSIGLAGKVDSEKKVLSAYYASVTFMDAQVGRILAALEKLGLREHTIVVFTSDHGYHLGEHDLWQKMSLHEESTRIPLIMSVPGKKPAESHALVESIDYFPTFSQLAGLAIPKHCQGRSLTAVLDDPGKSVREAAYCFRNKGHMLRTDRWAYLSYPNGSGELYDMKNDPKQYTNLIESKKHAKVLADMNERLKVKLASMRD